MRSARIEAVASVREEPDANISSPDAAGWGAGEGFGLDSGCRGPPWAHDEAPRAAAPAATGDKSTTPLPLPRFTPASGGIGAAAGHADALDATASTAGSKATGGPATTIPSLSMPVVAGGGIDGDDCGGRGDAAAATAAAMAESTTDAEDASAVAAAARVAAAALAATAAGVVTALDRQSAQSAACQADARRGATNA